MKKLISGVLLSVLLVGCSAETEPSEVAVEGIGINSYQELIKDDLYFIEYDSNINFATKYQEFLKNKNDIEVFDIERKATNGSHNGTGGWYIFTKSKEIKE